MIWIAFFDSLTRPIGNSWSPVGPQGSGRGQVEGSKHLGKFHHDLTNRPKPTDDGECKGESSPFMAARFRFLNYVNLPRYMYNMYNIFSHAFSGKRLNNELEKSTIYSLLFMG